MCNLINSNEGIFKYNISSLIFFLQIKYFISIIVKSKKPFSLLFTVLLFSTVQSQITIRGKVNDSALKPISTISITLENLKGNILGFAISNKDGDFYIFSNLSFSKNNFFITFNGLGYKSKTIELKQAETYVSINLEFNTNELPNVVVKSPRSIIRMKSDTLSYKVDDYINEQDRSIGDVLKRLPGIEVDQNGAIKFNGKSISNLYVDGDDLLNDKYNLITSLVKAKMVNEIQVLENHFPIKVLKSSFGSDKVAINLNINDSARLQWAIELNLGMGFSNVFNYDENLNSLLLKKKHKVINAIKINNSGVDVSRDLISHNILDYQQNLKMNNMANFLELNIPANPSINKQRYFFNNSNLATINNFIRTKKNFEIKSNFYYLSDRQLQDYNYENFFFLPTDTIRFLQTQQITTKQNTAFGEIDVIKNDDKIFISNKFKIEYNNNYNNSYVNNNNLKFNQNLNNDHAYFSNDFNIIKNLGKTRIIEFFSHSSYQNKPANLNIQPGINDLIFNSNISYSELIQNFDPKTLFFHNYIHYRKSIRKVETSYKIGFIHQEQYLKTNLLSVQLDGSKKNVSDSFLNDLKFRHTNIYAETNLDFTVKNVLFRIKLPISAQAINYYNPNNIDTINYTGNRVFFMPSISMKVPFGPENNLLIGYAYTNTLGNLEDVFVGYVLKNFNLLSSNNLNLRENKTQNITIGFQHRKAIKAFFFNLFVNSSKIDLNGIVNNFISNEIQKQVLIPLNNQINTSSISMSLSKYFLKFKTNASLKSSVNKNQWTQLQNNSLQNFSNLSTIVTATINPKINKSLNVAYNFTYNNSVSQDNGNKLLLQSINQRIQSLEINTIFTNNFLFRLKGESTFLQNRNLNSKNRFFFLDATFLYKIHKKRADISLDIYNIANNTKYEVFNISANNFSANRFLIRPIMILLKVSFQL